MGKKSSPAAPAPIKIDPWETAESQYEFGKKAALYNKQLQESTFQQTPYGTLRYENVPSQTPQSQPASTTAPSFGKPYSSQPYQPFQSSQTPQSQPVPITRMIQELHPAEQRLLDQQRSLKGQYGDLAGQLMGKTERMYSSPINMGSLGPMPTTGQAGSREAIQAIIDRYQPGQNLGMGPMPAATRRDYSMGAMPTATRRDYSMGSMPTATERDYSMGPMPVADQASREDFSMGAMPVADQATRQSIIDSTMERFRPQQTSDRAALETRLANQGFTYGATGWESAMDEINRRENDFRLATNQFAGGEMRADLAQKLGMREQGFQEKLQTEGQLRANLAQLLGMREQEFQGKLQIGGQQRADLAQRLGMREQEFQELIQTGGQQRSDLAQQLGMREQEFQELIQTGGQTRADLAQRLGMREQEFEEKLKLENQRRADLSQQLSSNLQMENQRRADLAQQLGMRQQSLQELLLPRNQTLQELSTFMTGSAPTMPQFGSINAPQVNAPDYAGLAMSNAQMQNQANMNAYQAQIANQGPGLGSTLGFLGGSFLGGPGGAALGSKIGGWSMGG